MATENMLVVDADSHWSEPADMFTSRAPEKYKDRVPHVEVIDGQTHWVFDNTPIGMFAAGAGIAQDGSKAQGAQGLHPWGTGGADAGADEPPGPRAGGGGGGTDPPGVF